MSFVVFPFQSRNRIVFSRCIFGCRGFDALDRIGATHIVFTNGLKDGWSVGGVRPADFMRAQEIYVFDLPNGAHHSGAP